jgi:peptide chain release factor 1
MHDSNPYAYQLKMLEERIAQNQALMNDPELGELAKIEIEQLQNEYQQLEAAAAQLGAEDDTSAQTAEQIVNCMIEIRQGAGGDEAKIWGNDLLRMYMRYIETTKLKIEIIDELVIKVKGKTEINVPNEAGELIPTLLSAYDLFRFESGVHRVQRVPSTESQGRVHTSTASVAVIPEVKKTAIEIKDTDLEWQFMRAGGAGGQNVNKVNSAARLTHIPTGISVSSRQERSQSQNREIALEMLRGQLWELQEEKRLAEIGDARSAIGRAQRAEKIRTYNYPQNRVTDHRINESWYSLETIMEGDVEDVFLTVRQKLLLDPTLSAADPVSE